MTKSVIAGLSLWKPKQRKHNALELLREAERGRLRDLLPIKRQRMQASPFGFFRGAAPVMAYDLSLGPVSGIVNQLCGDAHVQNLGAYAAPDGSLTFDINDFDETIRGPFEWDVKRAVTSILLAGEQAHVKPGACREATEAFLAAYTELVRQLAPMPVLEAARFQVRRLGQTPVARLLAEAERATPTHLRDHLTEEKKGVRTFCAKPPLLRRVTGKERKQVLAAMPAYCETLEPERQHFLAQFRALDVAFKVVGTGSVGLRDYVVYLQGNGADDPLFLQIKQEVASAYAPYLPKSARPRGNQGRRVVNGQRSLQLESDPLLGWTAINGRDFLVRQLNDHKATLDVTTLDADALAEYARVCGEMLARGHARSGSARAIAEFIGRGGDFATAMLTFAEAYAEQAVDDWKVLVKQART